MLEETRYFLLGFLLFQAVVSQIPLGSSCFKLFQVDSKRERDELLPFKLGQAKLHCIPPCIVNINLEKENSETTKSNDEAVGSIKTECVLRLEEMHLHKAIMTIIHLLGQKRKREGSSCPTPISELNSKQSNRESGDLLTLAPPTISKFKHTSPASLGYKSHEYPDFESTPYQKI